MPGCTAITIQGHACHNAGVDHPGGIRCGVHWRMFSQLINQQGLEDAIAIQAATDGRHIMARANRRFVEQPDQWGADVPDVPVRELQRFAQDNQNVHTLEALNRTKEIVKNVLKIPVPPIYKWNVRTISKTPGAIIINCGLSINAGRCMVDRYTLDDNIYEMGKGIYGRVLDGVWQYIKNSEDKKDLCKILAQELKDNVGMCLQGNLSRLCNVLAGYMARKCSGDPWT